MENIANLIHYNNSGRTLIEYFAHVKKNDILLALTISLFCNSIVLIYCNTTIKRFYHTDLSQCIILSFYHSFFNFYNLIFSKIITYKILKTIYCVIKNALYSLNKINKKLFASIIFFT